MKLRLAFAAIALSLVALPQAQTMKPSSGSPTIEQFLSPAYPLDLTSAKKADRLAWVSYDEGKRNIYTAAAPAYQPVRLTSFLKDDGTDMTDPNLSDDGAVIVFVRGTRRIVTGGSPTHPAIPPDRNARSGRCGRQADQRGGWPKGSRRARA